MDRHKEVEQAIRSAGEELAEKLGKIDPQLVVTLTVGSQEHAKKAPVRPSPEPRPADSWINEWHDAFSKTGDGFANIWRESPHPPKAQ